MPSSQVLIDASDQVKNFRGFTMKDGEKSILVAAGNGAAGGDFGAIPAGTYMGEITASGKYRPCGKQVVDGAQTTATPLVQTTKGFYVGDIVTAWDVSGAVALYTGRTITAINRATRVLTISGAAQAYAAEDYIFVEDGSGSARGLVDEMGADTFDGREADGDIRYSNTGGTLVHRGVLDETATNANHTLNDFIKADLNSPVVLGTAFSFQ